MLDSSGAPVPGARVSIQRPGTTHSLSDLLTDEKGRLAVSVIAGRPYQLRAYKSRYGQNGFYSESAWELVTATGVSAIRLRLAQSR